MLDFLPSLFSLLSLGTLSSTTKKAINDIGRHKAIAYSYVVLVILLLAGTLLLGAQFYLPQDLLPLFAIQVVIGGIGAIAAYKALHHGKASLTAPVAKSYVLLVLAMSIFFLGETLSTGQIAGSLLIVLSAFILTSEGGKLTPGPWLIFLAISIACRAYYYTFIKTFVLTMGAFEATVALELGITLFVIGLHSLRGRDLSPPTLEKGGFAYLNGGLLFAGSLLYSVSVGIIGAALTAAISAGTPIVNSVVSYFLLGERLNPHKYAAIALLVLGLAMIFLL